MAMVHNIPPRRDTVSSYGNYIDHLDSGKFEQLDLADKIEMLKQAGHIDLGLLTVLDEIGCKVQAVDAISSISTRLATLEGQLGKSDRLDQRTRTAEQRLGRLERAEEERQGDKRKVLEGILQARPMSLPQPMTSDIVTQLLEQNKVLVNALVALASEVS